MNLLVTGGCGFIGSNFIEYSLVFDRADFIINIDKLTYAGWEKNIDKCFEQENRYKLIKEDVATVDISQYFSSIDAIVHMAAETHVDRSIANSTDFIMTNVVGTHNLLSQLRKSKLSIPFLYVSTDEVYGSLELDSVEKFKEDTPLRPRSPYAASKASADMLCQAFAHTYGMDIRISRCSNNYGKFQFPEKFIPVAIYSLMDNKPIPLYGDGLYVRDWIHVKDHCRALFAILDCGKAGNIYNIGANNEWSNLDIAKLICGYFDKDPDTWITHIEDRPGHDRRYAVDSSKLKKELNWETSTFFYDGLQETVEWYKNNRGWWKIDG